MRLYVVCRGVRIRVHAILQNNWYAYYIDIVCFVVVVVFVVSVLLGMCGFVTLLRCKSDIGAIVNCFVFCFGCCLL